MSLRIIDRSILHADSQAFKALSALRRTGRRFVEEERRWTASGARDYGEYALWLQS